ncbi:uncharacterized protein LOC130748147 [Lotus japonicus]|uniref:uncharacterized protein LOC130748147 n=1 Tax=Lotus japonicus TaxID=34305 RepID=UPI0025832DFC|nr:uncharacterized protein LOC130748147 [Lotus japonicus]
MAATNYLPARANPTIAEAGALQWVLQMAHNLESDSVIFETDSKGVVDAYMGRRFNSHVEPVLSDCRQLVSTFEAFDLKFTRRGGNSVAHTLASKAYEFPNAVWWENVPSWLDYMLLADVFSISI